MIKKRSVFAALISFIFVLSMSLNLKYTDTFVHNFNSYSTLFYLFVYFVMFSFVYYRKYEFKKSIAIISFIMSLLYIISFYFLEYQSIYYAFKSPIQLIKIVLVLFGYSLMSYYLLYFMNDFLHNVKFQQTKNKAIDFIFNKHPFIMPFIIILVCYIPVLIVFYPGVVMSDGFDELRQYTHQCTWSLSYINLIDPNVYINGHHSPLHTVFLGGIYSLFSSIWGPKAGIFGYVIVQAMLQAAVFAYSLRLMKKLKVNLGLRLFVLLMYCLLPFFNLTVVGVYKDITFVNILLLFVCCLIEYTYLEENRLIDLIKLLVVAVLVMLTTNKGIYIVFVTMIALIIKYIKHKKLAIVFVLPILFYICYTNVLLPALHVTPGSIQETLSLPIQQVARYVVKYENELTDEEISNIDALLEYENIVQLYDPLTVDPIKNKFNKNYTDNQIKEFMGTWFRLFLKHPGVYVSAFANMYSGYFNYDVNNGLTYYYNTSSDRNCPVQDDDYENELKQIHPNAIEVVRKVSLLSRSIPVLNILVKTAFYIWGLILLTIYMLFDKRKKYIIPFIPSVIAFLFLFVSPVGLNKRYVYPIIYTLPILFTYVSVIGKSIIKKDK